MIVYRETVIIQNIDQPHRRGGDPAPTKLIV